jgi:hypothetical protein
MTQALDSYELPFSYFSHDSHRLSSLPEDLKPYELWNHATIPFRLDIDSDLEPVEEDISLPQRRLNLSPSRFLHSCVCGHNIEIREPIYDTRKRRNMRITIRPKTLPVPVRLRST